MQPPLDHSIRSILIIRLSAIGDVVMASGLIPLLRARYPHARLAWLVQREAKDMLSANPALDNVIVWPRHEWLRLARSLRWWRLMREIAAFTKALRAHRFDLVIDVQGLLKSGIWAWLSQGRERVGLGSKEGSARLMTRVIAKPRNNDKIASEYRYLARELNQDRTDTYRMSVAVSEADHTYSKELLLGHGIQGRYAVICPFTTRPQKHWFEPRWTGLVARVRDELNLPVVMIGGPSDRVAAARIAAASSVVNIVGDTSLRQTAALIREAALLVGVDTGFTHVGTASGIPTVALFGSTRPYLVTDSPKTQVLYHALECSPCHRRPTCGGVFTCMRLIEVDEVMRVAKRLLV
jgi:heptosyltransferase-1